MSRWSRSVRALSSFREGACKREELIPVDILSSSTQGGCATRQRLPFVIDGKEGQQLSHPGRHGFPRRRKWLLGAMGIIILGTVVVAAGDLPDIDRPSAPSPFAVALDAGVQSDLRVTHLGLQISEDGGFLIVGWRAAKPVQTNMYFLLPKAERFDYAVVSAQGRNLADPSNGSRGTTGAIVVRNVREYKTALAVPVSAPAGDYEASVHFALDIGDFRSRNGWFRYRYALELERARQDIAEAFPSSVNLAMHADDQAVVTIALDSRVNLTDATPDPAQFTLTRASWEDSLVDPSGSQVQYGAQVTAADPGVRAIVSAILYIGLLVVGAFVGILIDGALSRRSGDDG